MTLRLPMLGVVFLVATPLGVVAAGSPNGSGGDMPAYYCGQLFTINFKELPPNGEAVALAHNKSINVITGGTSHTGGTDDLGSAG